jgi:hypothetical protein
MVNDIEVVRWQHTADNRVGSSLSAFSFRSYFTRPNQSVKPREAHSLAGGCQSLQRPSHPLPALPWLRGLSCRDGITLDGRGPFMPGLPPSAVYCDSSKPQIAVPAGEGVDGPRPFHGQLVCNACANWRGKQTSLQWLAGTSNCSGPPLRLMLQAPSKRVRSLPTSEQETDHA